MTNPPDALAPEVAVEAALPALAAPPPAPPGRPLTADSLRTMLANRRQQDNGWTPIKVAAFIEALAQSCSVVEAAAYVNMSTSAAYNLRNHPDAQAFRDAWDSATAPRFEELTDIAMQRVRNGVEKNRWWHDRLIGADTVYSDRLLIHMLKRTDPDRIAVLRAAAPAFEPPVAAPALAALPLADDYIVAAAVEIGKLGWDPENDVDELRYAPDLEQAMAQRRTAEAKGETDFVAMRAKVDAMPKHWPHQTEMAAFSAAQNRVAVGEPDMDNQLDRFLVEDAEHEREYENRSRAASLAILGRGSRSSASSLRGSSSLQTPSSRRRPG